MSFIMDLIIAPVCFLLMLLLVLTIVFIPIYYMGPCVEHKTIDLVGGCNRYGCGVQYTDGTYGEESQPIHGMIVCTRRWR